MNTNYTVTLPTESGYKQVHFTLSVPIMPPGIEHLDFGEHVFDNVTGRSTSNVILCGKGKVAISENLGHTWKLIPTVGYEQHHWRNSFTTSSGHHIIQSLGWQGPLDPVRDEDKHATILVYDKSWTLIDRVRTGSAHWHGTASVGESNGVIMFAEYHNNLDRYRSDFEKNKTEYMKVLRSNAIWRSVDGGLHWHKSHEFGPLEIRHFHTVIPDRTLPGSWWASSGDMAHECRIWYTANDGDTWTEATNADPNVPLPVSYALHKTRCQRYTDAIIDNDCILWGADDYLGPLTNLGDNFPIDEKSGSRLYFSHKTIPINPVQIGLIGHPVRKLVDVGPGWLVFTEAKYPELGISPCVFILFKHNRALVKLFELKNWSSSGTGFTYSRGSTQACDGCFFTYRAARDVFDGGARVLKWQIEFE